MSMSGRDCPSVATLCSYRVQRNRGRTPPMVTTASFACALLLALVSAGAAMADDTRCLDKEQQRAAIASGKAVRLGVAVKAVKRRGEVVRARLCERGKGLVY